jgi:NRAMP (natural resistance-associated macrophage protein)-like metal ion transporter
MGESLPLTATGEPPRERSWRDILGPGLVTGASDDDPSGIATYSQAGAQYGYSLGWTLLLTYPLMWAIQLISAQVGRVTGVGLAGNMRRHYPAWLLYVLIGLLLLANTINIGADLGAMAAGLHLLVAGPMLLYVAGFALFTSLLQVFVGYERYAAMLRWLSLSLLAYAVTVFVVGVPWLTVARDLVVPDIQMSGDYFTVVVAVFGTTISPYLFFWQAGEEVEDVRADPDAEPLIRDPAAAPHHMARMRIDTAIGMGLSNLIALFIMLTTAATLHAHGKTDIQSATQAAEALRPLAGSFAFTLFALGIVGTGLLAVPVLAGSAAYALGETFGWRVGLAREPRRAKSFYGAICAATVVGAAINFMPLDPIKALFWSAVINGVTAVPIEQHLTLALETGFQASEKSITEAIADSVLSKQIDGVEATLNRNGYTTKVLTEMLGVKPGELRGFFKNELGAERARDLKEQMLSAGLPV